MRCLSIVRFRLPCRTVVHRCFRATSWTQQASEALWTRMPRMVESRWMVWQRMGVVFYLFFSPSVSNVGPPCVECSVRGRVAVRARKWVNEWLNVSPRCPHRQVPHPPTHTPLNQAVIEDIDTYFLTRKGSSKLVKAIHAKNSLTTQLLIDEEYKGWMESLEGKFGPIMSKGRVWSLNPPPHVLSPLSSRQPRRKLYGQVQCRDVRAAPSQFTVVNGRGKEACGADGCPGKFLGPTGWNTLIKGRYGSSDSLNPNTFISNPVSAQEHKDILNFSITALWGRMAWTIHTFVSLVAKRLRDISIYGE